MSNNSFTINRKNDLLVSKFGRDPNLYIKEEGRATTLQNWGNKILDEMTPIAEILDSKTDTYSQIIKKFRNKIKYRIR